MGMPHLKIEDCGAKVITRF